MDAAEILEKLDSLGVEIAISGAAGDKLRLNPGAAVPAGLMAEVKQRKNELIKILKLRDYQPKYLEPEATDKELAEIMARVYSEGYILLWSTVLEDLVAFYKNATRTCRTSSKPSYQAYWLGPYGDAWTGRSWTAWVNPRWLPMLPTPIKKSKILSLSFWRIAARWANLRTAQSKSYTRGMRHGVKQTGNTP